MRCNLIQPWFLTDQHLIAERRELRMIPPLLEKRTRSGKVRVLDGIPSRFCLGGGHMLFWLDKFLYLENRYMDLTREMLTRGFKPNLDFTLDVSIAQAHGCYNDWTPEPEDYDLIVSRLRDKIEQKFDWYRFCGAPITREWFAATYPLPYR